MYDPEMYDVPSEKSKDEEKKEEDEEEVADWGDCWDEEDIY